MTSAQSAGVKNCRLNFSVLYVNFVQKEQEENVLRVKTIFTKSSVEYCAFSRQYSIKELVSKLVISYKSWVQCYAFQPLPGLREMQCLQ